MMEGKDNGRWDVSRDMNSKPDEASRWNLRVCADKERISTIMLVQPGRTVGACLGTKLNGLGTKLNKAFPGTSSLSISCEVFAEKWVERGLR